MCSQENWPAVSAFRKEGSTKRVSFSENLKGLRCLLYTYTLIIHNLSIQTYIHIYIQFSWYVHTSFFFGSNEWRIFSRSGTAAQRQVVAVSCHCRAGWLVGSTNVLTNPPPKSLVNTDFLSLWYGMISNVYVFNKNRFHFYICFLADYLYAGE